MALSRFPALLESGRITLDRPGSWHMGHSGQLTQGLPASHAAPSWSRHRPRACTRVQAPQSPWSEKSACRPREGGHGWTVLRDLCVLTVSPTVSSVPARGPTQKESHEVPLRVPGTSTGFPKTSGHHLEDTCAGAPVRVFSSCFLELRKCERLRAPTRLLPSCSLSLSLRA